MKNGLETNYLYFHCKPVKVVTNQYGNYRDMGVREKGNLFMAEQAHKTFTLKDRRTVLRLLSRLDTGALLLRISPDTYGVFGHQKPQRKSVTEKKATAISAPMIARLKRMDLLEQTAVPEHLAHLIAACDDNGPRIGSRPPSPCLRLSEVGVMYLRRLSAQPENGFADQHRLSETKYLPSANHAAEYFRVNSAESPLGWLRRRKDSNGNPLISEAQFDAGETLRGDYTLAKLNARITTNWDSIAVGRVQSSPTGLDAVALTDAAIAARDRVNVALTEVGPRLSDILLHTCCYLDGLEETERKLGWPRRSGKLVLQIALDRLAVHYGLTGETR